MIRRLGLEEVRLRHPQQDVAALAAVAPETVVPHAAEPQPPVNLSRTSRCLLCHTDRPLSELAMAEDAAGAPFGPVCAALAPGKLDCLAVKELRARWETAVRLETKLTLERDEVQALWPVLKAGGW